MPGNSQRLNQPSLRLHLQTSRAFFYTGNQIYRPRENGPTSCKPVQIVDDSGTLVGALRLNVPKSSPESPDRVRCELIVISTGTADLGSIGAMYTLDEECCVDEDTGGGQGQGPPSTHTAMRDHWHSPRIYVYEFYNVLWIEWIDGIAYRRALGRVFKKAWESHPLEEVNVILG